MPNFKMYFGYKCRPMSRTIEYKGNFYLIVCRSTGSFDNLKNSTSNTIN